MKDVSHLSGACLAVQRDHCGEEQSTYWVDKETDPGQTLPSPQNMNPTVGKGEIGISFIQD